MRHAFIDQYSSRNGFLQRRDPRIKIISLVVFILFVVSTPPASFVPFALYGLIILVLMISAKIPAGFIFRRLLVIVPFVLMVAVFIPFCHEGDVAGVYFLGPLRVTVTAAGLLIFWNVLVKSFFSVLCLILLTASTGFHDLLKALQGLRCPRLIIMILSFMYRYVFILVDEAMRMAQARDARAGGKRRWLQVKTAASMIGVLFVRAYERGENVYLAMCSRGFTGRIKTLNRLKIQTADFSFLFILIVLLSGIRLL